ncbi:MAG TPA: hemerythrin family protein [Bryobacteraceae bacterium]|nr:hemerythrin family protein [Bryobacteraceae bacterium]
MGCNLLDRDHEVLLRIIDRLKAALADREQRVLNGLLVSVEAYFDAHMESEEELMRVWEYPAREEHKREHDSVRGQMHVLADAVRRGRTELAETALQLLNDWTCTHILGSDRPLALHLNIVGATKRRAAPRARTFERSQPAA